ncbi:MAG: monovalent cation:proton antiporter-2 (CPA2) family protein [Stappiaceae bacterium]
MAEEIAIPYFSEVIIFLGSAIVAVPIFKKLGFGSVLGFLAAGIAIGPFGAGFIKESEDVLHVAELGVVLLLFVIGLELQPSRLWRMKKDIFGLGTAQVMLTGSLFTAIAMAIGYTISISLVMGFGLALSSTAFALQIMQERGQLSAPYGQRAFGILLFQDISIVPLLAMVSILSVPAIGDSDMEIWEHVMIVSGAIALVILVGYYLLDPILSLIANLNAREVMLAVALLIVLGSAALLQYVGLSMALGAFLAGVMLADSSYRHTLEADIDPFRSLLMGLFFIGVGMSLDLPAIVEQWQLVGLAVVLVMSLKGIILWGLSRIAGSSQSDSIRIALTLPQGGEFAFVLFGAAVAGRIMLPEQATILFSIVILTMIMTPIADMIYDQIASRVKSRGTETEIFESFEDANANVLIVGFGRFGMVVAQMLTSEGINITAIDYRPERIRYARKFGYKVYYGDATRSDVLKAAGADKAALIALCIEQHQTMSKSIDVIRNDFPEAAVYCRAADRTHAIDLERIGVDYQIRETFESGVVFGRAALERLGIPTPRVQAIEEDVRERDRERLSVQVREGLYAGSDYLHRQTPRSDDKD